MHFCSMLTWNNADYNESASCFNSNQADQQLHSVKIKHEEKFLQHSLIVADIVSGQQEMCVWLKVDELN